MDKIKVLLVEDEETLAMIIKDTLEGQSFIIHTAADGEEGLRLFFDLRPDVLVADGFTGNVMLKSLEGTAKFLLGELKKTMLSSTKNKMAAAMLKGDLANMKRLLDPSEIGGTAFLGISKPVIKAHGSSNARAISNAILRAKEYVESGLIADIERDIDLMKVERKQEKM